MGPMMGGGVGKVSHLLISLAVGYAVLVFANKQERPLDILGRIIGGLIVLVSAIGLICIAACGIKCKMAACSKGANMSCDYSKPKSYCPMGQVAPDSSPVTTPPVEK
ncbi:MAG: hypothetical protein KCHDKBKB_01179 [Elusimicrobia bacterium]|nr:hypothetical protein [Elusimicrobiota bacterium]